MNSTVAQIRSLIEFINRAWKSGHTYGETDLKIEAWDGISKDVDPEVSVFRDDIPKARSENLLSGRRSACHLSSSATGVVALQLTRLRCDYSPSDRIGSRRNLEDFS
jgi:hypothetical protein